MKARRAWKKTEKEKRGGKRNAERDERQIKPVGARERAKKVRKGEEKEKEARKRRIKTVEMPKQM